MDQNLQNYIDSLKQDIQKCHDKALKLQPYTETIKELDKWLEEQKDADSCNK